MPGWCSALWCQNTFKLTTNDELQQSYRRRWKMNTTTVLPLRKKVSAADFCAMKTCVSTTRLRRYQRFPLDACGALRGNCARAYPRARVHVRPRKHTRTDTHTYKAYTTVLKPSSLEKGFSLYVYLGVIDFGDEWERVLPGLPYMLDSQLDCRLDSLADAAHQGRLVHGHKNHDGQVFPIPGEPAVVLSVFGAVVAHLGQGRVK